MSKNFRSVGTAKKMLSYGRQNGLGPFRNHQKRKAAPGATNTQDGKAEQADHETNQSTPIVGEMREDVNHE